MGHSYQPVQFLMKLTYNSRCSRQTLARDSPTGATPEKKNENLGAKPVRHRIPTKHEQCLGDALESTVYKAHKYLFAVQLSRVTCPGFEPTNGSLPYTRGVQSDRNHWKPPTRPRSVTGAAARGD